jgi:ATP synthase F1 gamma subunit
MFKIYVKIFLSLLCTLVSLFKTVLPSRNKQRFFFISDISQAKSNYIIFLFNFRSVISYTTTTIPIFSNAAVTKAPKLTMYDSVDADVLQSYLEYSLSSLIYYCLKEGACSEQSARMSAMDNASKNAGKCFRKLF